MNIPVVFWLVPFASLCALAMAWYFFKYMMKEKRRHGSYERDCRVCAYWSYGLS